MPLLTDPWFYALAVPGFLINGISKGGFASGAGNVAVPMMSMAIPAPQAAGIALPVLCAMDVSGLRAWWGLWSQREMRVLLPGGVLGIVLGVAVFNLLSARGVSLALGVITLTFLARSLWLRWRHASPPPAPPDPGKGFLWATLSGLTSTVAHAGGPPLAVYLYPLRLDRRVLAATTTVFFGVMNYLKLIPYWGMGLLDAENLLTSLVLLPLAPIGVWIGLRLHHRISDAAFYNVIYALLLVTGVKLVWDGLA